MIPCEFCHLSFPGTRIYTHVSSCPAFRGSLLRSRSVSSNDQRILLSDMLDALCTNEALESRDEDQQELHAASRFDRYDELDERYDTTGARHAFSASRHYNPATALAISRSPQDTYIVPFVSRGTSSYEQNLALADRIGRVTVGIRDAARVLRRSIDDTHVLCPICQDMCTAPDAVSTIPCNHQFCEPCITRWLMQSTSCPICKHAFA
jgi:hypothetical protein